MKIPLNRIRNRLSRLYLKIFFLCVASGMLFSACENKPIMADDLEMAKIAYTERNLALCERLLERYLRGEESPEKRWTAWNLLLQAINGNNQELRASLECLEAMLEEYDNDEFKQSEILVKMAQYNKLLTHYKRAEDCWAAYLELGIINDNERVEGLRKLAEMQFVQRHFEAGEETLQQCLALPLPESDKVKCMLDLADENMTLERWQEVADLGQQILELEPDDKIGGMAAYLRADALEQLGNEREALKQFEAALITYPNPAVIKNRIEHLKKILKDRK